MEKEEERCLRKLSSKNLRKVKIFTVLDCWWAFGCYAYIGQNLACDELHFEVHLTNLRKRIHSYIFRHHKTSSTDKCKNELNGYWLTTFALWLLQLHHPYRIVKVIFLHGKLARTIYQPDLINSSFHNMWESLSDNRSSANLILHLIFSKPSSSPQVLHSHVKEALTEAGNLRSVIQCNVILWAELAGDLEAAETGQRCTPHGPISTA